MTHGLTNAITKTHAKVAQKREAYQWKAASHIAIRSSSPDKEAHPKGKRIQGRNPKLKDAFPESGITELIV
jgi:hypothetical protein